MYRISQCKAKCKYDFWKEWGKRLAGVKWKKSIRKTRVFRGERGRERGDGKRWENCGENEGKVGEAWGFWSECIRQPAAGKLGILRPFLSFNYPRCQIWKFGKYMFSEHFCKKCLTDALTRARLKAHQAEHLIAVLAIACKGIISWEISIFSHMPHM